MTTRLFWVPDFVHAPSTGQTVRVPSVCPRDVQCSNYISRQYLRRVLLSSPAHLGCGKRGLRDYSQHKQESHRWLTELSSAFWSTYLRWEPSQPHRMSRNTVLPVIKRGPQNAEASAFPLRVDCRLRAKAVQPLPRRLRQVWRPSWQPCRARNRRPPATYAILRLLKAGLLVLQLSCRG